jgi:glycosyltransferase involved in cell wall biosynthesis
VGNVTESVPHLLHVFSTFVPAGPQVRTVGLIEDLGGQFRHSVLAMDGRTGARELLTGSAEVAILSAPPKAGTLRTVPRMRALLSETRPDLVLTYNFGAMDTVLAARTLGLPLIHHEDGFLPDEALRRKSRRSWFRRLGLAQAERVVVISETLERIALTEWHLARDQVVFVPNGIDVERFGGDDRSLRDELGLGPGSVVVGAVGHLRPEKNLPRLLEAAAAVAEELDLHVLILGEGPERERIATLASAPPLEGRVHLVGYHADPRAHYRAMDVFALTSDTEQMPIALLEAMASSLPVVATDVGDVRVILPAEQRRLVTAGVDGAAALARSLAELGANPELRRRLGSANRRRTEERFTRARMTGAYRDLYRAALAR